MDHIKAVDDQSVERYLLGELPAVEAEEFERHFFGCEECASAVETGASLRANARAVFAEPQLKPFAHREPPEPCESFWNALAGWWPKAAVFVPVAASLALAVLAFYQGVYVIPSLRQSATIARVLPTFQLTGAARGDALEIAIPTGALSFALAVDIPPDAHFSQYLCELSSAGHIIFHLAAPAPGVGQSITILVPSANMQTGQYQLTIYGANAGGAKQDKISAASFGLQFH
jgi:Putative zinc-finger